MAVLTTGEAEVVDAEAGEPRQPRKKRRESGMLKQVKRELAEEAAAKKLTNPPLTADAPGSQSQIALQVSTKKGSKASKKGNSQAKIVASASVGPKGKMLAQNGGIQNSTGSRLGKDRTAAPTKKSKKGSVQL